MSPLLRLAVEVGFDWVYYADESYVRLSVMPDRKCSLNQVSNFSSYVNKVRVLYITVWKLILM